MQQSIPQQPPKLDKLHKIDIRGKTEVYCLDKHHKWIDERDARKDRIARADFYSGIFHDNSDYM